MERKAKKKADIVLRLRTRAEGEHVYRIELDCEAATEIECLRSLLMEARQEIAEPTSNHDNGMMALGLLERIDAVLPPNSGIHRAAEGRPGEREVRRRSGERTTAIAIPRPDGTTARVIVPPQTASDRPLTPDEELMLAQHREIERLRQIVEHVGGISVEQWNALVADAERYRWLRAQCWTDNTIAAGCHPKVAIKLGYEAPSGECLDALIDEAMTPTR